MLTEMIINCYRGTTNIPPSVEKRYDVKSPHIIKFSSELYNFIVHKDEDLAVCIHVEECILQISYRDNSHQMLQFCPANTVSFFQLYTLFIWCGGSAL